MVDREQRLSMKISAEEAAMLRALAEKDGITVSDWVRLTTRRAYAEAFGTKKPKQK